MIPDQGFYRTAKTFLARPVRGPTRHVTRLIMAAVTALALGLLGLIVSLNVHASVPLNCAASPHVCGFPDATNTGFSPTVHLVSVPSQVTSGPGWKYDTRGWVEVSGQGASLSGLNITTNLDISASNVTINNVNVVETGNSFGISLRHTKNVTIENSDISSPDNSGPNRLQVAIKDIYGDATGTTVTGNNIWNTSTAVQIGEGTVTNNYIHNLAYYTGDHVNGIKSEGGDFGGLTITHNTVLNPVNQTDAIGLFENFGAQENCLISNNLIAGAGYTLYGGANTGKWIPTNIKITGNRIARTYYPNGGSYGPYTAVVNGTNGDVWSGNIWDNTGAPIN
jgi:hypothetical protein